jgi:L-rhamnose-H+ transport protein
MQVSGAALIVLGGVMEGLFTLPVKLTPKWSWENIWGSGSLAALALVPGPLLLLTVPQFWRVYAATPSWAIVWTILFGAGWGAGGIFFGLGVSALGLSLGTSSIMGLIAIGGSVVPLLLQHHGQLLSRSNIALFAGICVMLAGLIVCAHAGSLKSAASAHIKSDGLAVSYGLGALYCVAAGLLSPLVNFALIFGAPVARAATARGVPSAAANNAIWAIVFATNYLLNVAYCVYLGLKRGSFRKFMLPSTGYYWLLAIAMGLLWAGGIVIYGLGASRQGIYGPVFAFPVMLIVSILTGNLTGVLLGEWRGVITRAKRTMQLGIVIMIASIIILGCANLWNQ